jgi:cellulose synthase/poly-beta-1,6-N-acetylglucosamine synthase-like glycosyltransferase
MHWLLLIAVIPYFIFLLRIFSHLQKISIFSPPADPSVRISVVIPCRNESGKVADLLGDLRKQDIPPSNYELIFADDNSTDNTRDIIRSFSESYGFLKLKIITSRGNGKKAAISEGVSVAVNELIVTTDADCRVGPHWLSTISGFSDTYKSDLIICPVKLGERGRFFGSFQQLEFLGLQGVTAGTAEAGWPTMCNGANLVFTKEAYLRNSENLRHDIASGDDIFLLHSLKTEGARIKWLESQDAVVTADPAKNIVSFLNQRKRWISKGKFFTDRSTIALGIVTFVTILAQVFTLIGGFFNPVYWIVCLTLYVIKSVPDYLVLRNTAVRYKKKHLLKWFIPSQAIYPFYIICVVLFPGSEWKR